MSNDTDLHECPKTGCAIVVPFEQLACRPHWFSLPPELRRRISSTWRRHDLYAYIEARHEAEAFLNGAVAVAEETP